MSKAQAATAEAAPMNPRAPYLAAIAEAKGSFQKANSSGLDYQAESLFAMQACQDSPFLADVANKNPLSLRMAVANVAAIGLTLNPTLGYAFLVPRDGKVILDVSYRGLIKIATDIGSIKWAKAELVYAKDKFLYRGPAQMPEHLFDPFDEERGEFRGVYCVAKTPDGDMLVEAVPASEIYKMRDCSDYYVKKKAGPWVEWFGEQTKKSGIKRASKTWPKTPQDNRLAEALRILNEDNGEGFEPIEDRSSVPKKTIVMAPVGKVPAADQVSDRVRATVLEVVERARKGGAWAAAYDYVNQKYQGADLDYALFEINRAKDQAARAV